MVYCYTTRSVQMSTILPILSIGRHEKRVKIGHKSELLRKFANNFVIMETTRQNKIARLLQKELSDIFLQQTKAMPGVLISVSTVRISPDMSVARAYLSVFPSEQSEEIIKNVNANVKSVRYELGSRVRHQLRIIPELKFFVDDSLDYLERIDELLKE